MVPSEHINPLKEKRLPSHRVSSSFIRCRVFGGESTAVMSGCPGRYVGEERAGHRLSRSDLKPKAGNLSTSVV